MNEKTFFITRLILYLGLEFLLIQGGMTANLYGVTHNIGGLEMISWFTITGSLAAAVGFGALLEEARPDLIDGSAPTTLYRLAPPAPVDFCLCSSLCRVFYLFSQILTPDDPSDERPPKGQSFPLSGTDERMSSDCP